MAVHEIKLKITKDVEIVNTDIALVIYRNGTLFGTLTVSKGSIDWRPTKKWVGGKNQFRRSWTKFDKLMRG